MFSEFYQNGGVLMHAITLCAAISMAAVLLHGRSRRLGSDDTKLLSLSERMAGLALAIGVLGTLFGVVEMCAALATIEGDMVSLALRAGQIVPITLEWGLMCAIPLWGVATVFRSLGPVPRRATAS